MQTVFVRADVRIPEENEILVQTAIKHFGRLDAIVCNAGAGNSKMLPDYTIEKWLDAMNLNYNSCFYLKQESFLKGKGQETVMTSKAYSTETYPAGLYNNRNCTFA
ncbi:MAG: SDR family oxidoreductase [Oscillospiraceae bacterium]|nr:SDR family oxidoreductase [Oscillospiraceae bacterium]